MLVALAVLLIMTGLIVMTYHILTWKGWVIKFIFVKETKKLTNARLDDLLYGKAHLHNNPRQKVKE